MSVEQLPAPTFATHEAQQIPDMREVIEHDPSPLAAYMLGQLPSDLARIEAVATSGERRRLYEDLAGAHEAVLTEQLEAISQNTDPKTARKTQLDLLFMLNSYLPLGKDMETILPKTLTNLIQEQPARFRGLKEFMTYDMLINENSSGDFNAIRTFSQGQRRLYEQHFYLGHHYAEHYVRSAADGLQGLVDNPTSFSGEATAELLGSARDNLQKLAQRMIAYRRLPAKEFNDFRRYLVSYPSGVRNASGAFIPDVPRVELALSAPTELFHEYLDQTIPYFPDAARPRIATSVVQSQGGHNIEDQLWTGDLVLTEKGWSNLFEMLDSYIQFQAAHLSVTKGAIPEVFDSPAQISRQAISNLVGELPIYPTSDASRGTGNFHGGNVVINSVYRLYKLRERLTEIQTRTLRNEAPAVATVA